MAEKEEKNQENIEIDFGLGKIGFSGLFKGIGNIIDLVSKLSEEGTEKHGEISGLPKGAQGVYGFSIKTLGGKPVVESFGNIKETAKGPVVEDVREPICDIFDEKGKIVVIAELPGVSENEIKIEITGDILNLNASNKDRKYAKEILLPAKVKVESIKTIYKNGILEITIEKLT
jgi:HSP20 family protein